MPDPTALTIEDLEKRLLALMDGEFSSLSLTFNDINAPNYMSVADWFKEFDDEEYLGGNVDLWVSAAERDKAIKTNRWWSLQWYPRTPGIFHVIRASSLPALFEGLREFEDA